MTDPTASRQPGERPSRRVLDRAPGARFADAAAAPLPRGSMGRAAGYGLAGGGVALTVLLFGALVMLLVWPLVVAAAVAGFVTGVLVVLGAAGAGTAGARRGLAAGIAVGAVALTLAIAWAVSGRYLDPLAFIDQVYGLASPAAVLAAAGGALLGSR